MRPQIGEGSGCSTRTAILALHPGQPSGSVVPRDGQSAPRCIRARGRRELRGVRGARHPSTWRPWRACSCSCTSSNTTSGTGFFALLARLRRRSFAILVFAKRIGGSIASGALSRAFDGTVATLRGSQALAHGRNGTENEEHEKNGSSGRLELATTCVKAGGPLFRYDKGSTQPRSATF